MNRRGFLSLLGLGGASLMVPNWMVFEPEKLRVLDVPAVNLEAITLSIATEIERALGGYGLTHVQHFDKWTKKPLGVKAGQVVQGRMMDHQKYVQMAVPVGTELEWRKRYVEPAADTFAAQIRHDQLKVMGRPHANVPWADVVVVQAPGGLNLRGALQHDGPEDGDPTERQSLRFDIVGGYGGFDASGSILGHA